jgi:RND family efflux transporter MFP subunit
MNTNNSIWQNNKENFLLKILTNSHFMTVSLLILSILTLLFIGGAYSWIVSNAQSSEPELPASLVYAKVQPIEKYSSFEISHSYLGQVEPVQESDLGFEQSGRIQEILVDEGDYVNQGKKIAQLDTDRFDSRKNELQAQLSQQQALLDKMTNGPRHEEIQRAQAAVNQWKAQLELAKISEKRYSDLIKKNAASKQKYDEARLNRESIEAQWNSAKHFLSELQTGTRKEDVQAQQAVVNRLKAQIETIDIEIEKSTLLAPFDGKITRRFFDQGSVIETGQPIIHIMDLSQYEARIGMSKRDAEKLRTGDILTLLIQNQPYTGSIKSIVPKVETSTRTIPVVLQIHAEPTTINVSDLIEILVPQEIQTDGYWMPIESLTSDVKGLWACYIAEPFQDNSQEKQPYRISRRNIEVLHTETKRVYTRGVLREGELLVIDGIHRLIPGQLVNVLQIHS